MLMPAESWLYVLLGWVAAHLLWWAYAGGVVLRWFLKASAVAATPASPIPSRGAWMRRNWRGLGVRQVLSAALFVAWCWDPGWIKNALGFPLNPGTAFLYGYLADSVLYLAAAKYRILDGQIPGYNGGTP